MAKARARAAAARKIKDKWKILKTKVIGLQKAGHNLEEAGAGGLLGVLTELDPYLTKADSLTGCLASIKGNLPEISNSVKIKTYLF